MFTKLLIANRGEIACRIIRTAKRLGIQTVAVYSTADRDSRHVKLADEAYCIGAPPSSSSYLNQKAILQAAITAGVEAIHPGYGFLSENPDFAEACQKAGITFVGPSVSSMNAMASKQRAKQLLEKTKVPLTPGYHGTNQIDEHLLSQAKQIGFPILLKAAAGGGGKGMRAVKTEQNFLPALAGARREAKSSFGDDTMVLEKLIQNPRHVEIQILADQHSHVLHLFDRDCSIQRRHQKIIEEAPAPKLPQALHQKMAEAAITVAKTIEYYGAGTVEFLVEDNKQFYFMEMNTRLQVEHPVTEMITGIDLVEWQLRIAANEPLPFSQSEIKKEGHALECRIYAEDPQNDFMPSTGEITFLKEPIGDGIRIDTGVEKDSTISMYYDPMIAKLITVGENRLQALRRMQQALRQYYIGGVKTNLPFLQSILENPKFIQADLSTDFLAQETLRSSTISPELAAYLAASLDYLLIQTDEKSSLGRETFGWQMHLKSHWTSQYIIDNQSYQASIQPINQNTLEISLSGKTVRYTIELAHDKLIIDDGVQKQTFFYQDQPTSIQFYSVYGTFCVQRHNWETDPTGVGADPQLTAPMPSTVVAVMKKKGDVVKAGEPLLVLEAMKMEHTISAPKDGTIEDIFYEVGSQVQEGAELVTIEPVQTEEISI